MVYGKRVYKHFLIVVEKCKNSCHYIAYKKGKPCIIINCDKPYDGELDSIMKMIDNF